MRTKHTEELLARYYKAETSLEEEAQLKEGILSSGISSPETETFLAFQNEAKIPDGLENQLFDAVLNKQKKKKTLVRTIFSVTSAAAVLIISLSVYLDFRDKKIREMENNFMVMEHALYQVSETLQPNEPDEMLVLWVDNDVEIIIN